MRDICRSVPMRVVIFWSFTRALVKTNPQGKVLKKIPVADHHGDVCLANGKVYCAVNFGAFNHLEGRADNWVYVYAARDPLLSKHKVPQVKHGAGGIAERKGRFMVVADCRKVCRKIMFTNTTRISNSSSVTSSRADGHALAYRQLPSHRGTGGLRVMAGC